MMLAVQSVSSAADNRCGGTLRELRCRSKVVQGQSQCSFLFDVSAKSPVSISSVSFVPGTAEGDFEIWTTPNAHERVHHTQKAWSLVAKGSHTGPAGEPFAAQLTRHVIIPKGERHAFYVVGHNTNSVCFSPEGSGANSGENGDVIIHLGHFKSYPWESQLSTGPFGHNGMQEYVGSLEYQVLQSHAVDHVVSSSTELWEKRPFPDAQVVANDGRTFEVHRAVLSVSSTVLEAAWSQPLREKEERVLKIDAAAPAVEALLRFMYTGQASEGADSGEMLRLAHLFSVPALVRDSAVRLADEVTATNAVASVRALRPYREDPEVQEAWRKLLAHIQGILAGNSKLLEEVLLSM